MPVTLAPAEPADSLARLLDSKLTRKGVDLATLSLVSPILLVFLRHPGCVFCREALADLAESRSAIEKTGTRIVVVHLGDEKTLETVLDWHNLGSLDRIHDEDQSLYRAFGLGEGTWWQLAGPRVWVRGISASLIGGHRPGAPAGDVRQMPGMFLLDRCEVKRSFRHASASDRPLYEAFVREGLNQ
jgi:peroxiredoxin